MKTYIYIPCTTEFALYWNKKAKLYVTISDNKDFSYKMFQYISNKIRVPLNETGDYFTPDKFNLGFCVKESIRKCV